MTVARAYIISLTQEHAAQFVNWQFYLMVGV